VLDGRRTTSLAAFHAEVGRALLGREDWGAESAGALDALLADVAARDDAPVRLAWRHAAVARAALGRAETVRHLTDALRDCAPNVLIRTAWALRAALRGEGPTLFDGLVARLGAHPDVRLVLDDGVSDDASTVPGAGAG
jgi:hypothetical protein